MLMLRSLNVRPGLMAVCLGLLGTAACAAQGKPAATETSGSAPLDHPFARCSFAYRESASSQLREVELSVAQTSEQPSIESQLGSFRMRVSETKDESRGAGAVSVWVASAGAPPDEWLGHALYQLGAHHQGLALTMSGGHGFTGLHYVRHPSNGTELQWWCVDAQSR